MFLLDNADGNTSAEDATVRAVADYPEPVNQDIHLVPSSSKAAFQGKSPVAIIVGHTKWSESDVPITRPSHRRLSQFSPEDFSLTYQHVGLTGDPRNAICEWSWLSKGLSTGRI